MLKKYLSCMCLKLLGLVFVLSLASFSFLPDNRKGNVITFIHNYQDLISNRNEILSGNPELINAKKKLIEEAQRILKAGKVYSVTVKKELPPSGNIHDFYSLSRYWWPNPNTKSGLPYVSRDGRPNPARKKIKDAQMLGDVGNDVYTLGLAYFYTGNETYVRWAKKIVSIFFLNKKTRMNPNFRYSQVIKGKPNSGGATISAMPLVFLVEGIQLMRSSSLWSSRYQSRMEEWFIQYLDWMLHSEKGQQQRKATNNIGVYYTVQVTTYALFTGQTVLAKEIMTEDYPKRIAGQISATGAMKYELKRATPWNYVKYNLRAWKFLVEVAKKVNIDLWDYVAPDGGSIKKAFYWLIPYALKEKHWDYGKDKVSANQAKIVLKRSGFFKSFNYPYLKDVRVSYEYILTN